MKLTRVLLGLMVLAAAVPPARAAAPQPCAGTETWTKTGEDVFGAPFVLPRSQGVTHDADGWIFSWQGGMERTNAGYQTEAAATWPYDNFNDAYVNADRTNRFGGSHVGDVDTDGGIVYAPVEDGNQDIGIMTINDPEYQQSHVALYDAKTLLYTGVKYAVDPDLQRDGIPWVAIDHARKELYTGEWNMPRNELNVFDLQMRLKRKLTLQFPASFGEGFHLSRIQGGEVFGDAMYAARDDKEQTVYRIDVLTGAVTKLFSLNGAEPSELEGLAIYPTPDGALLHVMLILDNDFDDPNNLAKVRTSFQHFSLRCD